MWLGMTFFNLWNQNNDKVDSVIPFCGMPCHSACIFRGEQQTHVVHDHVEGRYSVRGDEEKLVRIIRKRVDVPDFAFCQQLQLR